MMSVSDVSISAGQPLTTARKVPGASRAQNPEEAQNRQLRPAMDEYVPEEPRKPSGRYWMGRDEAGRPKIYFDGQSRAAPAPEQSEGAAGVEKSDPADQGARGPEKKEGEDERWACNTGKADREIERLKKKRQELKRRLNTETEEAKVKDLERQLSRVEQELKQKDSDTYRKQNSTFTRLS